MNSTYQKIKSDLTSKEKFHIELGLERIRMILELLGNPQDKIKTIHIAGTNGKGSVSVMLAKILETSGYKAGLFTSPHLVKYNERIKISSEDISDADLEFYLEKVNSLAKAHNIPLTEFEILTAVGFLYFYEKNTDIAVIETGLGGRLDATNCITPLFEVITSISLDHTERLGDTIEKIAYEKAGIIKKNSTVIINENNLGLDTIKNISNTRNADFIVATAPDSCEFKNFLNEITINGKTYKISLLGDFQGENLSLVIEAIEILKKNGLKIKDLEKALLEVKWTSRMQFLASNVILDGAHNPSAAKRLREFLDKNFPDIPRVWFYGSIKSKDYERNVKILCGKKDIIYFVKFNLHNSCSETEFKKYLEKSGRYIIEIADFQPIYNKIKNQRKIVIICGSLYFAGEVLALLDA